jgi:type II secretory pathway component PulC
MVVTGIITSAKESVAIVAAEGRSRLVQVGDTLPGGIRVMSINAQGKSVIVSHGGRSARLAVKE